MYAKITNGQVDQFPYTVGQLRRDNPNTSFPRSIPDEMLAEFGVLKVNLVPVPNIDERTQRVEQNAQPHQEAGQWFCGWTVTNKTQADLDADMASKMDEVRSDRNIRLAKSDWTQGKDIPDNISTAWATYRQALRDVPAQAGFPWTVEWPTQPE